PSEITPKSIYMDRRKFMQRSIATGLLLSADAILPAWARQYSDLKWPDSKWPELKQSAYSTADKMNSLEDITTYNNFYEFGTGKQDPHKNATEFNPRPWTITVTGECDKPGTFDLDDVIKSNTLEERIYRLRCVEGWSMVIPWVGFSLADMLKKYEPNSKAKFVEFTTLLDKSRMPGQERRILNWPYVEALRIDEAMNELPIMAVGLYGEVLPNQNGAPIRLVVPWKYGFKSIKSIVKIRFTETMPKTTWNETAPNEYGFYSNVNPTVDHPRWSQKKERVIGRPFWEPKRDTQMFNGYGEQVASLYTGMDLKKYF
ncbi:MAG: protein-methionine-sulfoxide reductase catalytic subunit MsrP, partial [Gammaproteobacteria bacterium]|nr:protein-methionine-sulfoxide reductase catalytic subunit MsrP [Gammaproteobacteria bacterium]